MSVLFTVCLEVDKNFKRISHIHCLLLYSIGFVNLRGSIFTVFIVVNNVISDFRSTNDYE